MRIRDRDVADAHALRPTRREGTSEAGADQGVPFLFVAFLWASKEKRPRVQGRSHPPLAFEIARKVRDNIQNLDSRLRGNDSYVTGAEPPAISFSIAAEGGSTSTSGTEHRG